MKKMRFALMASAALLGLASFAQAAEPGPYASGGLGLHLPDGSIMNLRSPLAAPPVRNTVQYEPGFALAAAAGYRWVQGFRSELEIGYRDGGVNEISGIQASGRQSAMGAMANLLFEVGIGTDFHPYIGGGAGIARTRWKNVDTAATPVFDDYDTRFQWQAIVGIEFPVNDRVGAFIDYRYITANGNTFKSDPAGSLITGHDNVSHNVMVGVRYTFDR